jgi:hypothetical protein
VPPFSLIERLVNEAFHRELTVLNEFNEISFLYFKAFLVVYETTRLYFANLGTKTVSRDIDKLMEQRVTLLKDMATMKAEIQLLSDSIGDDTCDLSVYEVERGGDFELLQLGATDPSSSSLDDTKTTTSVLTRAANYIDPSIPTEEQRLRRFSRRKKTLETDEDADKTLNVEDAKIFENGCLLVDSPEGVSAFELAFSKKWQFNRKGKEPLDGELLLTIDLIEDLFESIGVR